MSIRFSALTATTLPFYSTQLTENVKNHSLLLNTNDLGIYSRCSQYEAQNQNLTSKIYVAKQSTSPISTFYQAGLFAQTLSSLHHSVLDPAPATIPKSLPKQSPLQLSQSKYESFKAHQQERLYRQCE
ncbi:hypothetical protein SS50377_26658 [Spironucleus salmonicida]|uniref:Uncharacterized protein n=1 Tax=Spironucleus salmonicida TaxID=348837 RepID=A0A9P8LQG5_9EUKA|nr:hypothetical protein SS50377_26658 [Spironucleus salmonicida]